MAAPIAPGLIQQPSNSSNDEPSLENQFNLDLKGDAKWENPYVPNVIKPYIPPTKDVIPNCRQAFDQSPTAKDVLFTHDAFILMLGELDPIDLANFSEVSKCC